MEYGEKELLDIPSLQLHSGDKVGIVGVNGCGKSTLLDIIAGRIEPIEGYTVLYHDYQYIQQLNDENENIADNRQKQIWGIADDPKSGGEITRHKIAKALSSKSRILLCDEPSSNLDEESIIKLENELVNFAGGILLVSHDRKLLNTVCNYIWEIDEGNVTVYRGNYDDFKEQKQKTLKNQQKEYEKYIVAKNSLEQAARETSQKAARMKSSPKRMGNSEARLHRMDVRQKAGVVSAVSKQYKKRLGRLEKKEKPKQEIGYKMRVANTGQMNSKTAIRVNQLSFSYGDNLVLDDISLNIARGERIAITGCNGSGKSTLLNAIVNRVQGTVVSPNYTLGYFSQDISEMNDDITILDYIMESANEPQHVVRTVLGHLGIRRQDVFKKLIVLSGGERCKVKLAQLIVNGCSILILDEPTNYLDVYVLEALEKMLAEFDGTLLVVSHDRYFLEQVTDRELRMENGKLIDVEEERQKFMANDNDKVLLEFRRSQLIQLLSESLSDEKKNMYETEYQQVIKDLQSTE